MTPETEAEIRNVRKFGRIARFFCAAFFGFGVVTAALMLVSIAVGAGWMQNGGTKIGLGPYMVTGDHLTTFGVKAWCFVVVAVVFALALAFTLNLYRLFTNLGAGEIYTKANVRHLRQVGLIAMALAVVQLAVPPLTFALVETGVIDRALVSPANEGQGVLGLGPASLSGFVTAALLLLASWIMDVGRATRDEADAMRREAELVI